MDLVLVLSLIAALFVVVALSEPLAARLGLPFTVILAGVGVAIGGGAAWFWATDLTDALNPVALAILQFPIRSNIFLYIFLPTLLFQVSLALNLRRMLDDWVPILTLAVVAVVVATFTVGLAVMPFAGLPLMACLLLGAIVSTTDPSAVVSIFRSLPAPQRLARIVEGESLLNDAAAIALFGLFLGFVSRAADNPDVPAALLGFPWLLAGGALGGWALARIGVEIMARMPAHPLAQVTLSVALPYIVFILSERVLGTSGVVAVVAAGLALNLTGPGRLAPATMASLRDLWEVLAHWAGSFIFVLAALLIPRLLSQARLSDILIIGAVIGAALVARGAILFGLLPLLSLLRLSPQVDRPYRVAILWGGLRGAVTLALALAVTESLTVPAEVRRTVGIAATGFVLWTLIVQGITLRPLIRRLGLDRLSPVDEALGHQVVAVALQSVRDTVSGAASDFRLSGPVVAEESREARERTETALLMADEGAEILDKDRIKLGLVALAARERERLTDLLRRQVIAPDLAEQLLASADDLAEAARQGGRSDYLRAARRPLAQGRAFRAAEWLHNRTGWGRPLASRVERRFDILSAELVVLRELHGFVDRRIARIHGARVAELLHDMLDRRLEEVEAAREGLRLQFPGYAEELERRLIRRIALQLEEREYDLLTAEGLVGPELRTALRDDILARRAALAVRPRLDLALQKADLIGRFPLFAGLDEGQRRALVRRMRTVYARPGRVLLRRSATPREVWFIASGAVETRDGQTVRRLGTGEMFGQLSLLARRPMPADVITIAPTTLLVLDETRFLALLRRAPDLCAAVETRAAERGVALDPSVLGRAAE